MVSKPGLNGLTKNIAATYGPFGIRCVAVCPGGTGTGMGQGAVRSELSKATFDRIAAAKPRNAQPLEQARVALFLASDEASFVNGAIIVVDGGWTAH